MKLIVPALFALLSFPALASAGKVTLTVKVSNIPRGAGNLLVGLYDSDKTFAKTPLPQSPRIPLKNTKPITVRIPDLKPGTYAIVIVHDLNGNGKLDKNFIGMPKEPLAFSQDPKIPMGLPSFKACSFVVGKKDLSLDIPLKLK